MFLSRVSRRINRCDMGNTINVFLDLRYLSGVVTTQKSGGNTDLMKGNNLGLPKIKILQHLAAVNMQGQPTLT